MPVQIGICDDRADDLKTLADALYAYDDSFQITQYMDGEFLFEDCVDREILFDIIFLDIYMPGLNGIKTAEKIRAIMKDVIIIFVSSSNEHYPEAYDVFAFNYIIKPINTKKLNSILDQAFMNITKERRQQIQFTYKATNYRILCRDILYIESRDKIILFHMTDRSTLQCYAKLDEILKQLPEDSFIRCHQSYAVNVFHVTEMAESHFRIRSAVINISKKYQKTSKDKYFEYIFTHMNNRG
ncbi:MAG: response regulator of the LytR/AlgR family [Lachnospiraceae bacterium]|jgi:DNA-binding LytR/AlgR family response regulator|nr:response regulator of the LytR/AlgR family [Lachnospiraceae bacterium]